MITHVGLLGVGAGLGGCWAGAVEGAAGARGLGLSSTDCSMSEFR